MFFLSSKTLAQVIKHFVGRKERRKGRKERRWRKKRMKEGGCWREERKGGRKGRRNPRQGFRLSIRISPRQPRMVALWFEVDLINFLFILLVYLYSYRSILNIYSHFLLFFLFFFLSFCTKMPLEILPYHTKRSPSLFKAASIRVTKMGL